MARGASDSKGPYADPNTSLIYMRARWYDPSTGQFLSVDPDVAKTQQPYSYANDNPIDNTDPTGRCPFYSLSCDANDVGSVASSVGGAVASAAPVVAPVVDVVAGAACIVADPCALVVAGATIVQEGLVAAQAGYTPGYNAEDALTAQVGIVSGDALAGLGSLAAANSDLGFAAKALLSSVVGAPQTLLDSVELAQADGIAPACGP
jgi:RHS repeat-associated protein